MLDACDRLRHVAGSTYLLVLACFPLPAYYVCMPLSLHMSIFLIYGTCMLPRNLLSLLHNPAVFQSPACSSKRCNQNKYREGWTVSSDDAQPIRIGYVHTYGYHTHVTFTGYAL
jgi:hypothetical protein